MGEMASSSPQSPKEKREKKEGGGGKENNSMELARVFCSFEILIPFFERGEKGKGEKKGGGGGRGGRGADMLYLPKEERGGRGGSKRDNGILSFLKSILREKKKKKKKGKIDFSNKRGGKEGKEEKILSPTLFFLRKKEGKREKKRDRLSRKAIWGGLFSHSTSGGRGKKEVLACRSLLALVEDRRKEGS